MKIMTLTLLLLLVAACGGDDDPAMDPASSEHCVKVRKTYLDRSALADQAVRLDADKTGAGAYARVQVEKYKAENWECFK